MLKNFVPIRPQKGQEEYYRALQSKDIIFVTGNAGSGKTFLALNQALQSISNSKSQIDKICIIRPYIFTHSENLGALPGYLDEKVLPFVKSIEDNLIELLHKPQDVHDTLKKIEFLTLSTLRGRSLHNRFIIVEEAQNVPIDGDGMLTILTRIGKHSKMVIAGDLSQTDINPSDSAFLEAVNALAVLDEVAYVQMDDVSCIYRNKVIGKILKAFNQFRTNHG